MTQEEQNELYRKLLENSRRQMLKCMEEMGELTQALCRFMEGPCPSGAVLNVSEEIADVGIMIDQMTMLFDRLARKSVAQWREEKLLRLMSRMDN
ncbi:MAG: hypothetical protein IJ089_03875 [Clostridia bacterium]|nr:hypothetical protein [Clostridia bacterium]